MYLAQAGHMWRHNCVHYAYTVLCLPCRIPSHTAAWLAHSLHGCLLQLDVYVCVLRPGVCHSPYARGSQL